MQENDGCPFVQCPSKEADESQAATVAAWLKQAMLDGMAPLIVPVPVEVEVKIAKTWGG